MIAITNSGFSRRYRHENSPKEEKCDDNSDCTHLFSE